MQFGSGKNTYVTVSCKLSRKYPKTPKCLCIMSCVVHQGVYISFRYFLRGNTLKRFATFAWKVECLLKVSFFFSIRTLPKDVIHARWFYVINKVMSSCDHTISLKQKGFVRKFGKQEVWI